MSRSLRSHIADMTGVAERTAAIYHRSCRDEAGADVEQVLEAAATYLGRATRRARWGNRRIMACLDNLHASRLLQYQVFAQTARDGEAALCDDVDEVLARIRDLLYARGIVAVHRSAYVDTVRAWLCLGQAKFALEMDGLVSLFPLMVPRPPGADIANAATRIRSTLGQLRPLAVTLVHFSANKAVAVPAGLVALAWRHLSMTLTGLAPEQAPPQELDVAAQGLGIPNPRNFGEIKDAVHQLCARMHNLTDTIGEHATHIATDARGAPWGVAVAENLYYAQVFLRAAKHRYGTWADAL